MAEKLLHVIELPFGARISVMSDVDGALSKAKLIRDRLANRRPIYLRYLEIMRLDARRQFSEGGGDVKWKPLAPSTIATKTLQGLPARNSKTGRIPWRLKQGGQFTGANVLIATGRLRDSWSLKNDREHVERVDEQTDSIEFGSTNRVAKWMQHGTKPYLIPKGGVPGKKRLRFMSRGGQIVFARVVHHPGIAARPVTITRAAQQAMTEATQAYILGDADNG